MRIAVALIAAGWCFATSAAHASVLCDYYKTASPHLYKQNCGGSAKPAGSNSSFSQSFNLNSAALPTEPSAYGIETLGSHLRDHPQALGPIFSIIKGFQRFGTGVSTAGSNTFYGNDIVQRATGRPNVISFDPPEEKRGKLTNLNIGTSFLVLAPKTGPALQVGLTARYNNTTATWGGGSGLMIGWKHLSFGGGFTRERVSNSLPPVTFTTFVMTARLLLFEFEYSWLRNFGGYSLEPIHIASVTLALGRFTLTFAGRRLQYLSVGRINQPHAALQIMLSPHFSVGALYNFIPGANTLGLQIYL